MYSAGNLRIRESKRSQHTGNWSITFESATDPFHTQAMVWDIPGEMLDGLIRPDARFKVTVERIDD